LKILGSKGLVANNKKSNKWISAVKNEKGEVDIESQNCKTLCKSWIER